MAELIYNGFYREVELPDPEPDYSDIQEKYDELEGESAVIEDDDRHTLLEIHCDMIMPPPFEEPNGLACPYVITIDKSSRTVLSIRKNWYENDSKKPSDYTSPTTDTYPDSDFMEPDSYISSVASRKAHFYTTATHRRGNAF